MLTKSKAKSNLQFSFLRKPSYQRRVHLQTMIDILHKQQKNILQVKLHLEWRKIQPWNILEINETGKHSLLK